LTLCPLIGIEEAEGIRVGEVLGRFVQELNGEFHPLKNEKSVALEVVSVNLG
jgi:hypothetical protein